MRSPLFSNGSEYETWSRWNCDRCAKATDPVVPNPPNACHLQQAILDSAIDTGRVTEEVEQRLGARKIGFWRCREFQAMPGVAIAGAPGSLEITEQDLETEVGALLAGQRPDWSQVFDLADFDLGGES